MTAFVVISDGLPTPQWDRYLPCVDTVCFAGENKHKQNLYQYAKSNHISFNAQIPVNPFCVLAFWNGTPDAVDALLCQYPPSSIRLFLLNENGRTFEEYTPTFT